MTSNEMAKECRILAKQQSVCFKRSETINKINGLACYEIKSGITNKALHRGNLNEIYETLLSECCKN